MTTLSIVNLVVSALVFVWLLYRQMRTQPMRGDRARIWIIQIILIGLLGAAMTIYYATQHKSSVGTWPLLVLSLLLGMFIGAWRGSIVRIWSRGGIPVRKGDLRTVILWVVGLAVHYGLSVLPDDHGSGVDQFAFASLLLYLSLSATTQRAVTLGRVFRAPRHDV